MQSKLITTLALPILLATLLIVGSLHCQGATYSLVVTDTNGHTADFPVDAALNLRVHDHNIRIESTEGTSLFEIDNISKLTYSLTDPGSAEAINTLPTVKISGHSLHISTPTQNRPRFTLCDLSGTCMAEGSINGELSIDLSEMPKGIYLFKLENSPVIKFTLK